MPQLVHTAILGGNSELSTVPPLLPFKQGGRGGG